jgi:hypothetical protein
MKLSPKAARIIIEALSHYQEHHDRRINEAGLTEEEASDLTNDRQYLEAIKRDFGRYEAELLREQKSGVRAGV